MKFFMYVAGTLAVLLCSGGAQAQSTRYVEPPPVVVSPDLSAPWVLQLRRTEELRSSRARGQAARTVRRREHYQVVPQQTQRVAAVQTARGLRNFRMDPKFLPRIVAYDGPHKPGTIVIDTSKHFLYLIEANGQARRYGVGVGKEGFGWTGTEKVTAKKKWPDWRPPADMIAREKEKGRIIPKFVAGGPQNPLGARALYLGSTLYRIHGTNAPWTIGRSLSSGCIRMRNEDVVDLYERVSVGAKVVVI